MKRKLLTIAVATLPPPTTTTPRGNKAKDNTQSATETASTTEETAIEDALSNVKGIKDLTVEVGAKDVDYLKNVTYDKKYIKSVTVDSSDVKVETVGKYKLVYTVTPVDTKNDIATVVKTVTVEVITTDDAQTKADNGEVVITDNGETKKASDGTTPTDKSSNDVSSDNTEVTTTKTPSAEDNTSKPASGSTDSNSSDNAPAKTETPVSEPTQPAKTETAHTHNWVAVTETVTVTDSPATTRQELVSAAYDETVVDSEEWSERVVVFNYDGYIPTSEDDANSHQRALNAAGVDASCTTERITHPAVTHVVHHDAVTKTVDVPAVTHTEDRVVGYKCSGCNATK